MKLQGKRADEPAFATTPCGALVMFGGARQKRTTFSDLSKGLR